MMVTKTWSPWLPTKAFLLFILISGAGIAGFLYFVSTPHSSADPCLLVGHRILTTDESSYFPKGLYSQSINISQLKDGDAIKVGGINFQYHLRPSSTNSGYDCAFDCRSYFDAALANGSLYRLDSCQQLWHAQMTAYVRTFLSADSSYEMRPVNSSWSVWEISQNVTPTMAVHVAGFGPGIRLIEIAVSK
jgi:hypothetical protein